MTTEKIDQMIKYQDTIINRAMTDNSVRSAVIWTNAIKTREALIAMKNKIQ